MRINKYVAQATGISRRAADQAIAEGRVSINGELAKLGDDVEDGSIIELDHAPLTIKPVHTTIMLNKPSGYVVSRDGQGSKTIYDLLPEEYHNLKPVGRLDKDSSGLLLLTDDGDLAHQLTHPRYAKTKIYEIELDKALEPLHQQMISDHGIQLDDGPSKLALQKLDVNRRWQVTMSEGRNRQIRRTFTALGYSVVKLHRKEFGEYKLNNITDGRFDSI
jgi:23S rRNA pseudouridine2605 synthase